MAYPHSMRNDNSPYLIISAQLNGIITTQDDAFTACFQADLLSRKVAYNLPGNFLK
jgi:hypothetical protein